MKRKTAVLYRILFLALAVQCIASPASGSGVPVYDSAAHAARLDQLAQLVQQLDTMRGQLEALTGSTGFGAWYPDGLQSTLPVGEESLVRLLAGHDTGDSAQAVRDQLREEFQLELDTVDESIGSAAWLHNLNVRMLQGREAVARVAYDEATRDIQAIAALSGAIDGTDSVKAALDLQNRILAQNAKSVLAAARMIAAAEVAEAHRSRLELEQRLRVRGLARPRFFHPQPANP